MPEGPNGQKRPRDVVGTAVMVAKIATGQIVEYTIPNAYATVLADLKARRAALDVAISVVEQRAVEQRSAMEAVFSKTQARLLGTKADTLFCAYCGHRIFRHPMNNFHDRATIDHIISISRGGSDFSENLKPSCLWCNNGKEISGGCIAALRCAEAIIGKRDTAALTIFWRAMSKTAEDKRDLTSSADERK